jgi:uncharacterized protein YndB with AHSA1/START domain
MVVRKNSTVEIIADREIVSARVFDAPREIVWKAWTSPTHLKEWWGPRGFTNTFEKFDFRPGGLWRFTMHGPTGKDFHNECVFQEIDNLEKIVFDHLKPLHKFRVTTTLKDHNGNTEVTFRMLHDTVAECVEVKKYAVEKNEENFDRLEEELAAMQTPGGPFEISHLLDVSLEQAWEIWTDCKHLRHWWGPKGFKVAFCKMDLRPDGMFRYCLNGPDGIEIWGRFLFRDIVKPKRLVFVSSFSDEKGGLNRHPLNQEWPLEILSRITFDEKNGKTQVTVKWHPINASAAEIQTFEKGRTSMKQGWSGTFSQLDDYISGRLKENNS